jgi:hypothetical protein
MAKVDAMLIKTEGAKIDAMQREALQRQQEALRERTRQPPK